MEQSIIVRESRPQALVRLAGCGAFAAASAWALLYGYGDPAGFLILAVCGLFFAIGALRFAWSVVSPGELAISATGLEQTFGWRKRRWKWAEIDEVRAERSAATLISYCTVYPTGRAPVRLFGWEIGGRELKNVIDRHRAVGSSL